MHYIGVDLSKKTIDLAYRPTQSHTKIENQQEGFMQLVKWLESLKLSSSTVMLVMEHTGLYSKLFEQFLHREGIQFCKVTALEIKRSIGMTRGKSDKIDAARIALYAEEKSHRLRPNRPTNARLERLKLLRSTRESLVKERAATKCRIKELTNIKILKKDILLKSNQAIHDAYTKQIEKIEAEIEKIIQQEESLSRNFELLKSIKGVGNVLALATIIKTENFTRFPNARKFACYCGTAPFEHSSGSSIRGKTKVSHLADKGMKTLLELSARSAVRYNPEIRNYYQRRVAEGKSKQSTLNIVRNKIIYRMFAVIKRQMPYVAELNLAA